MSSLYFDVELDPASASLDTTVSLVGAEARHAATVSRVRIGETISIGNGQGFIVSGPATAVAPDRVVITVADVRHEQMATPAIWLAQALAKGDRDESAVQAACELGVDGVIPWSAQRSIVKWEGAKVRKGQDRWSAIVREAAKQSIRAYIPEIAPIVTTRQLTALCDNARVLVLDPQASAPLSALVPDGRDVVLVVGPEGGISPGELQSLVAAGAEAVRLGQSVLRTGTAGPAAIVALSVILGRW